MIKNEDFFQIIGQITIFFATLDLLTTILMTKLNKSSTRSKIKGHTTLTQKFRILKDYSANEVVDIEVLKSIKEILPEAIKISKKRNRFIHDQWIFIPEKIELGKIERAVVVGVEENRTELKKVDHTLDDLYALLREIGSIQKIIGNLIHRLE